MITLSTDFGYEDHYVAVMKAVIYGINPDAKIVDITHGIQRHSIMHAAYVLRCIYPYFGNAIHVFVVDPGVGTARKGIAAKLKHGWFVGPDNGILTLIQGEVEKVYEIELPARSATFHGRDIFAPAAARIDMGQKDFLREIDSFITFPYQKPEREGDAIRGEIIHVDHFGNVITNIPKEMVGNPNKIILNKKEIPFKRAYGLARKGELIALINSEGLLEFGVNMGSAQEILKLKPGDRIKVALY